MTSKSRCLTAGTLSSTSGQVDIDLKTGTFTLKGPAGNIVVGDLGKGDVVARIDGEHEIETLQIGGVTLYGELASKVREAQEILTVHGAGELRVMKSQGEIALIDAHKFEVNSALKTTTLNNGLKVMAGINGESSLAEEVRERIERASDDDSLASAIRQVIREELRPGGLLHRR